MDMTLIFDGQATLEDLCELHDKKGYDIIIENGTVGQVVEG